MFSNLVMTTASSNLKPDIYQLGRAGMPRPLQNIIYFLQALSPGLIVVRSLDESDFCDDDCGEPQMIDCGLPPSLWVGEYIEALEDVFGTDLAITLYRTSDDSYSSIEEVASKDGASADTLSDTTFDSSSDFGDDWASWPNSEYEKGIAHFDDAKSDIYLGGAEYDQPINPKTLANHPAAFERNGKIAIVDDGADYRHCDAACHFCGRCSDSFAARLTELLLRVAA